MKYETYKKLTEEIKAALVNAIKSKEVRDLVAKTKEASDTGSFQVVISTADQDRQGESVDQAGWDLTHYKKNPVVLWGHDYYSLPIGITESIEVKDNQLVATGRFAPAEANPFAQQVRRLYDLKIVRATSVGFIAKEVDGNKITKAELLEFSFVPVPANPYALSNGQAKELGLDLAMIKAKGLELKTDSTSQPEETPKEEPSAEPAEDKPEPEKTEEKGAVADAAAQINDPEVLERKWQRLDKVLDIVEAFIDVYLATNTKVEEFEALLTETVQLLNELLAKQKAQGNNRVKELVGKANPRIIKNVEKIGALLTSMQNEVDDSIVRHAKQIVQTVESEYAQEGKAKEKQETPEQPEPEDKPNKEENAAVGTPETEGGEGEDTSPSASPEGEQAPEGAGEEKTRNQRSDSAGLKEFNEALDSFLLSRKILRSFVTQATAALERMNDKARKAAASKKHK